MCKDRQSRDKSFTIKSTGFCRDAVRPECEATRWYSGDEKSSSSYFLEQEGCLADGTSDGWWYETVPAGISRSLFYRTQNDTWSGSSDVWSGAKITWSDDGRVVKSLDPKSGKERAATVAEIAITEKAFAEWRATRARLIANPQH